MTVISDLKQAAALAKARAQPNLCFLTYSMPEMLSDIRAKLFPEVEQSIQLHFVSRGPLACIAVSKGLAQIYVHQVLNHPETPAQVLSLILKHELLHLRIPPVVLDGKEVQHPPEFWAAETELCPERSAAWNWIWGNLCPCLKRRRRLERIDVVGKWRQVWSRPWLDITTCQQLTAKTPGNIEDGGW